MTANASVRQGAQPDAAPASSSVAHLGLAASIGTALEFYDFSIYGTAAALVFGQIFFRSEDAWFATFLSLATFAVGFLMAPFGAILFGWMGDRYGRRLPLILTFTGMGLATLLMGVLPSYAAIGVAAPILLVILRMAHGITRGGESAGAAVLVVEHAPTNRRGLFGSFVAIGSPIGTILANLAFSAVLLLPDDSLISWGWRLPFLAGGLVLLIGLWVRKGVSESPVYQQMAAADAASGETRQLPLVQVLSTSWHRVLLTAGVNIGLNASTFVLASFMLSYATADAPEGLGLPRQPIVWGSLIGLVFHAVANIGSAWLSDRVGRKPVMLAGAALSLISALVMFHLAMAGTVAAVNTAIIIGFTATGVLFGPMYTYFTELYPREQRQSGMGLGYHLGAVLGGGLSPMVANRIVAGTDNALNVGYYLAALLVLSMICLLVLPETSPLQGNRGRAVPSFE